MFTKLNNRITRTLAATLIPAAMTLGLAGNTFADVSWTAPAQMIYMPPSPPITFSGTANDTTITLQMFFVGGTTVKGTLTVNGTQYYFVGCEADNVLNGVFNYGGNQVTFQATGVANSDNIEIPCMNTSMTLELVY
jgi:hypothetical protein